MPPTCTLLNIISFHFIFKACLKVSINRKYVIKHQGLTFFSCRGGGVGGGGVRASCLGVGLDFYPGSEGMGVSANVLLFF